jgi:hypothetical protein
MLPSSNSAITGITGTAIRRMLIKLRFRFSEIFFGMLLVIAVFAMGMLFSSVSPTEHQNSNQAHESPQNEATKISAEERIADYTLWLTWLTAILAGSTVGLWGVTYFTLRHGRETAERQLRAYVSVKTVLFFRPNIDDGDNQEWPIHLVFQNAGQTPAYALVIKAERCLVPQQPIDKIFALSDSAESSPPCIMAPDGRHTMQLGGIEPGHASFLNAQRAGTYCYVWGRVDYIDTFGRKHFTEFQMWQNFSAIHQFGFCQVGNKTDDEFPER